MSARSLTYEHVPDWGRLPEGWTYTQVAAVAVDSQDRVYVYNRGEHPVVVFDRDGHRFLPTLRYGTSSPKRSAYPKLPYVKRFRNRKHAIP